jgi:subtilisin family serine protease
MVQLAIAFRSAAVVGAIVGLASIQLDNGPAPSRADGSGVHAYVIDTGVRKTHRDFTGRVEWAGDFVRGQPAGPSADDCDPPRSGGHGTHVASLLGGATYGVAPGVALVALRILPCSGTDRTDYDAAIRAVDWVTRHAVRPAVANMSPARWSTPDTRLDEAIERSIRAGIPWVLSAGGVGDLAGYSPQRVADAIVVAATDEQHVAARADYGPSLTLFARGVGMEAAGNASDSAVIVGSGDSFAAPLVAGAAALYLEYHPHATPAEVKRAVIGNAVRDVVRNAGTAPNRLLQVDRRSPRPW